MKILQKLTGGLPDLLLQFPGGNQPAPFPDNDDLFKAIRGGYCHVIFMAVLMGKFLYILVGSFRLFCIHHVNIVVIKHLRGMSLQTVGIEYRDQITFPDSLIITENVQQLSSGAI